MREEVLLIVVIIADGEELILLCIVLYICYWFISREKKVKKRSLKVSFFVDGSFFLPLGAFQKNLCVSLDLFSLLWLCVIIINYYSLVSFSHHLIRKTAFRVSLFFSSVEVGERRKEREE